MTQYLGREKTDLEIAGSVPAAMERSARFDPVNTRRILQDKGFRPWQILRYAYRPFDLRWLYWERQTELLDRKREDYVSGDLSQIAFVIAQKSRTGYKPPQVTNRLIDLNATDGGANVYCYSTLGHGLLNESGQHPNQTQLAATYIERIGASFGNLFFHALATMHTPQYRTENSGALLGDWPRIPLPAIANPLRRSADLGRRLADLLDPESCLQLAAEWSFLAALKLPRGAAVENALKVTAGWGYRGQGSTVMPGQGLSPERPWSAAERDKIAALAATESLTLEGALALLGETCVEVHLNGETFWSAVPRKVWNYTLGGYQVLKKWLSYRELPLLGRALHPEEAAYFAQVVRRITAVLLLGPALDASYAAILPTANGLITPPATTAQ
jgi:hypothetical protein